MHLRAFICIALAIFSLGSLEGCVTDYRKDIAYQTLFSSSGMPNTGAFAAALASRFPPGSSVTALQSFVAGLGGSCHEQKSGRLWCEIAMRTRFCAASMLGLNVTLQSGAVGKIAVTAGGLGC
jgi:hypothetical protein